MDPTGLIEVFLIYCAVCALVLFIASKVLP